MSLSLLWGCRYHYRRWISASTSPSNIVMAVVIEYRYRCRHWISLVLLPLNVDIIIVMGFRFYCLHWMLVWYRSQYDITIGCQHHFRFSRHHQCDDVVVNATIFTTRYNDAVDLFVNATIAIIDIVKTDVRIAVFGSIATTTYRQRWKAVVFR